MPHLEELAATEVAHLTAMQTKAMCERVNDILYEFHSIRHSDGVKTAESSVFMEPGFSSSRLLIKCMPLDEEHVKQMIMSKLSSEQVLSSEVASGRKDISEAMNIDFIVGNFEESVREELAGLSEDITSALLAATVNELAEEIEQMESSN